MGLLILFVLFLLVSAYVFWETAIRPIYYKRTYNYKLFCSNCKTECRKGTFCQTCGAKQ